MTDLTGNPDNRLDIPSEAETQTTPGDGDVGAAPSATAAIADLVTAIDHVGIAVADMDAAARWYANNFGFVTLHEEINAEQGVREAMIGPAALASPAGADADRSGSHESHHSNPHGASVIQLLAPLSPESTIAKFLDRNGPGLQQLALRVTDLDEVTRRLTEAGIRTLYTAPRRGTADSRINFVHPKDAGGVLLELVEPA